MKFVVPVSIHDSSKLDEWVDVVLKFGKLFNHSIEFIPTIPVRSESAAAAQRLVDSGISASVADSMISPESGWPRATNVMFFEAVKLMFRQSQPWMWMELDCLPVRSNWADALAGAYSSSGSRFMGSVVKTPHKDDITGKIVKSPWGDDDDMMCGCGVYPAGMAGLEELEPMINDFMKGPDSAPVGFDIYLRFGIKKYGRSHTDLIEDKWNTVDYRIESGSLVCSPLNSHEGINPNQERIPFRSKTASPIAATIHGCKDSSLHDLIMGGFDLSTLSQSTETSAKPGFAEAFPNPSRDESGKLQRLESELSETKVMLRQIMEKMSAAPDVQQPTADASVKPVSTIDALVNLIKSSEKKIRLDQASERLNIPINKLKAAIDAPDSPVKKGALGWLSFAETTV
jgi:hypothetical protein